MQLIAVLNFQLSHVLQVVACGSIRLPLGGKCPVVREAQETLERRKVMVFCWRLTAWRTEQEDKVRKNRILVFEREANRSITGELYPRSQFHFLPPREDWKKQYCRTPKVPTPCDVTELASGQPAVPQS